MVGKISIEQKLKKLKIKAFLLAVPKPRVKILYQQSFLTARKKILFALGLVMPMARKNSLAVFSAGALLIILVFGALVEINSVATTGKKILGATTAGFDALAGRDFTSATSQFAEAKNSLENSYQIFAAAGQDFLTASADLAEAGADIQTGADILENSKFVWDPGANALSRDFYLSLKQSRERFLAASGKMSSASQVLSDFNPAFLPQDLAEKFHSGRALLASAQNALLRILELESFAMSLLGGEEKTYLLIFQNNNEARATGGFIGTYGLLAVGNGGMRITKIESIYNLDGQLKEQIAAPGPMQRMVSPLWGLRDANWFADFPESSRKILEFLEKDSGTLAEGIISFTPDVFEQLLVLTGPVPMPEYGETLTAENFRDRVQYKTSIDYDREENQPKKFLADFAPRLLSKVSGLDSSRMADVLEIFSQGIAEKQILMFSLDEDLQKQILSYNAGGEVQTTDGDYLAIYHSNVGGGKTDQGIEQRVEKLVSVDSLGRQIVDLKITRAHRAFNEQYFPNNIDFMRIFVPKGSKILEAEGFDASGQLLPSVRPGAVSDADLAFWDQQIQRDMGTGMYVGREAGYTTFMNWLTLSPGQSKTVSLKYELPFVDAKKYTLLLQKQPGARPFEFSLDVALPGEVIYRHPAQIPMTISGDEFFAVLAR